MPTRVTSLTVGLQLREPYWYHNDAVLPLGLQCRRSKVENPLGKMPPTSVNVSPVQMAVMTLYGITVTPENPGALTLSTLSTVNLLSTVCVDPT
jgi:hypothetical protein